MAKEHQATPSPTPARRVGNGHVQAEREEHNGFASKLAAVAAVGLGVALIESELIPGLLIGAGAVLAPDLLGRFGVGLRPLIKGVVRAGYGLVETTKEAIAEASEQYGDIVAEVKSEQQQPEGQAPPPPRKNPPEHP